MINYYYIQKNGMAFCSPIELEASLEEKSNNFFINSFLENEELIFSKQIVAYTKLQQNEDNNAIIGFIGQNYFDFKNDGFNVSFKNKFLDITLNPCFYTYTSLLFVAFKNQRNKESSNQFCHIVFNDGSYLFLDNILEVDKKEGECYIITTNKYTYYLCQVSLFLYYENDMLGDLSLNIVYLNNHICIPNIKRNYLKIETDKVNDILVVRNKLIKNPFIEFSYIKPHLFSVFYTKEHHIQILEKNKNIKVIKL